MMRIMMIVHMRTTLPVDDDLLHELKARAHRRHCSLGAVLNEALRRGLALNTADRVSEPTITYGSGSGPDDAALRAWSARLDDEPNPGLAP